MDDVRIVIEISVPKSEALSAAVIEAVERATGELMPYGPTYRIEEPVGA